jgi:hypothetical protein
MADFEKGQTFLDLKATNFSGTKGKYYIALSDAEDDDDRIISFVMNTENRMDKCRIGCNKKLQKYILKPGDFSFIKNYTAIMLELPVQYSLSEMYEDNIKLLDKADDNLCRQIKNCIDFNYIPVKFAQIIKTCFK